MQIYIFSDNIDSVNSLKFKQTAAESKEVLLMVKVISNCLTDFLCKKNIFPEKEKPIYIYGFEILISSLIGFFLIFSIALLFGKLVESFIFYVIFVFTRTYTGGYHADSYLKCNIVLISIFLTALIISEAVGENYNMVTHVMISITYFSIIFGLSPIENIKKPLDDKEKARSRKISIVISFVAVAISVILYFFCRNYSLVLALTLLSVAMLMVVENCRKENDADEKT